MAAGLLGTVVSSAIAQRTLAAAGRVTPLATDARWRDEQNRVATRVVRI